MTNEIVPERIGTCKIAQPIFTFETARFSDAQITFYYKRAI